MRLRVVLVVAFALCLAGQPAFAQLAFGGGAKGGVAFSKVSSDASDIQDLLNEQRFGVVIGAFLMIPLNDQFVIQPEVLFVQKGASGSTEGIDLTFELDYVEIPILANFLFPTGGSLAPFVFTGPVPAFNTTAKVVQKFEGQNVGEEDFKDFFKTIDFLWTVGGGVQYQNLTIEARYTFGLGAANKNDVSDDFVSEDFKNRTFAILFGIILG